MSTPLAPDLPPVADVAEVLSTFAGGYLRNPLNLAGTACEVCRGPSNGASLCPQCRNDRQAHGDLVSGRVGVFTYAPDDGQTARAMYGYKYSQPSREHQSLITLMCHVALRGHVECVGTMAGRAATHWATVPSLKGRQGEHPLHLVVRRIATPGTEVKLFPDVIPTDARQVNPNAFRTDVSMEGRHVLVVDDTWARGGHAQSAAAALRFAGAADVSILVLARWLRMSWSDHKQFSKDRLVDDFDVSACPWTAGPCPPS